MIRVFRYSIDNDMRMIRVSYRYRMLRYTRAILHFLRFFLKNEDKFNGHMQCPERRKWHFRASNFKKFLGAMPPDPPSYARSLKMLRSDFWLDPPLRPQLHDTGFVSERHQFKVFSSHVCYYNFSYMKFLFNYVILSEF